MQELLLTSVDSTNTEARRWLAQRAQPRQTPCLILAQQQTAGRGTHYRSWHSPKDAGLYATLVVAQPALPAEFPLPWHTLLAGVALAGALQAFHVRLKPVNDLVVLHNQHYHKLGGILTEAITQGHHCTGLITGFGINLLPVSASEHAQWPPSALPPISLAELVTDGSQPEATALARTLAQAILQQYQWAWAANTADVKAWLERQWRVLGADGFKPICL